MMVNLGCSSSIAKTIAREYSPAKTGQKKLLGIPHAIVELASVNSLPGVIVKDFVSDRTKKKLTHGNELLAATISAYPKEQKRGVVQHTISRVLDALSESYVHLPAGWNAPSEVQSPAELFTGYLMLDVLIGNTDRRPEGVTHANSENITSFVCRLARPGYQ